MFLSFFFLLYLHVFHSACCILFPNNSLCFLHWANRTRSAAAIVSTGQNPTEWKPSNVISSNVLDPHIVTEAGNYGQSISMLCGKFSVSKGWVGVLFSCISFFLPLRHFLFDWLLIIYCWAIKTSRSAYRKIEDFLCLLFFGASVEFSSVKARAPPRCPEAKKNEITKQSKLCKWWKEKKKDSFRLWQLYCTNGTTNPCVWKYEGLFFVPFQRRVKGPEDVLGFEWLKDEESPITVRVISE